MSTPHISAEMGDFAKSDKALVKRVRAENAWNIIRVLFPFV